MAHSPADAPPDRDEPEAASPAAKARKRPGFKLPLLSLLAMIRLPSLGSERHEMILDPPKAAESAPAEPTPAASKKRPASRVSFLALKRETRVGIAVLLTFVVFVSALVVKKGWVGRQPLTMKIGDHPTEPEKKEEKPEKKEEKPGTGSEPATKEPNGPPEAPPADGMPPKVKLVGESPSTEPGHPPEIGTEEKAPATLATMLPPPSAGLSPPDDLPPSKSTPADAKLTDLPAGPTDPLLLPGDAPKLPGDPPATPVTAAEPPPVPETKVTSSGELPSMDKKPAEALEPPPAVAIAEPPPTPPVEPPPAPPSITEPPPAPPKAEATAPVLAEKPPALESVPTASTVGASTAAGLGAGWVVIRSGGRRIVGSDPVASSSDDSPAPPRIADGPRAGEELASADQVEPVLHRVRPGENFWTISKLYYRSGRYFKALHAANERQVPNIRELYVGTVLRIPPPEALDRSLVDPPARGKSDDPAATTASRTSKRAEPAEDVELAAPVRPRPGRLAADPEAREEPRRPTYTAKPFETLRSIARDTLNDPKRDREIFNLNRDVLDDLNVLPAGTTLNLPEDAVVGRRAR